MSSTQELYLKKIDTLISKLIFEKKIVEQEKDCFLSKKSGTHKLFSVIIHGNETIGLHLLEYILSNYDDFNNLSFLIGNRDAYLSDTRFVETDLNRAFLSKERISKEKKRAQEIERFAKNFEYILDIHQTTHLCKKEFCLVRRSKKSNNLYKSIKKSLNNFSLIYLNNKKLSNDGSTFSEFATEKEIGFITLELGQKGFSAEMFEKGRKILQNFNEATIKELPEERFQILEMYSDIKKLNQSDHLINDLQNLSFLTKETLIANINNQEFFMPIDGYILFPKYGIYQKQSTELCKILVMNEVVF